MQNNNEWLDVRMFYTKTGFAKYISHLDMVRCFTRAMKRANAPIWFTQGFNPRAFLTFAMPLSLGFESYCEVVDFRITEERDLDELAKQIDSQLPDTINILKIAVPNMKTDEIKYAKYEVKFSNVHDEFYNKVCDTMNGDTFMVTKKCKKGRQKTEKLVDIKENIIEFHVEKLENEIILHLLVSSGNENNINPMLIVKNICNDTEYDADDVDVVKIQSLTKDMVEFN